MPAVNSVEALIGSINMEEAYRRRKVRGRDLNEWHPQLDEWIAAGETRKALDLLGEIFESVESLEQFDAREPQPYWYETAAKIYRTLRCSEEEAAVLERWLIRWPPTRTRHDKARERFASRANAAHVRASQQQLF
jgi:Asp-tRNA(Asn)/Glu-tRNA(Gln) amidotransferase C subunit